MQEAEPQIFGAYLLLKPLGSGAMGDVWLARPLDPDRGVPTPIVIKRLHRELHREPAFVARFRHEATVAVDFDSPHLAPIYDVGSIGETLYIAMAYVPGWTLSKVLDAVFESRRHASIASVIDLIAGGLEGLDALHSAKDGQGRPLEIVHRDVSPKNLMVGEDGKLRLIDLGLGKSNQQAWKTRTGMVMGSVGYMAPEQARGAKVDARTDLYALAVVCFEMLALRNYLKRGTLTQMMDASVNPVFVPPSQFRTDIPPELDQILEKALAPNAEHRYQTAREFLDALRSVIPPAQTDGGMSALLEDLFGDTKAERDRELERLLAFPVPDLVEAEPTTVFGSRSGVASLDAKTKTAVNPLFPEMGARRSPGVLFFATAGTAIVISALTLFVVTDRARAPKPVVAHVVADPEPELPRIQPQAEPLSPELAPAPAPPAPPAVPAAKRLVAKRVPIKTIESAPPIKSESLDAELEQLRVKANQLKNDARDPERRDQLIKVLNQLSAWKQSTNASAKKRAVAEIHAQIERIVLMEP